MTKESEEFRFQMPMFGSCKVDSDALELAPTFKAKS